jgi:hypothetical protein
MAKKQIEIEIIAKGRPAERSIDNVDKKTKKLAKTTKTSGSNMTASWAKVGLAIVGVTAVLKKASEAHSVQLKAEIALGNALRLNAKQGEDSIEMWKDYASGLQDITLFGDEATLQQIALLKTMGLSDEQTRKLITTAMDYSTAFGKDMPSAVRELTMTLSGQLGTIKRTIPSIGEFTKEQLKSGEAIDAVSVLVKGQAAALAATPWGESEQLANSFGDEMERLGEVTLDLASESGALGALKSSLSTISEKFSGLTDLVKIFKGEATQEDRLSILDNQIKALEEAEEKGLWGKFLEGIQGQISPIAKLNNLLGKSAVKLEDLKKAREKLNKEINNGNQETKAEIIDLGHKAVILDDLILKEEIYGKGHSKNFSEMTASTKAYNFALMTVQDNAEQIATTMSGTFADMAVGIKSDFGSMARSIVRSLIQVRIQALITRAISGFSWGSSPTVDAGSLGSGAEAMFVDTFHNGTSNVKSFHSGNVRSDERLAKLQVGEAVINRGGAAKNRGAIEAMNKGYDVGGNGGNVTTAEINFNVQAIDASSFNNYLVNSKSVIENIINTSLSTNGSVRRTIKQVV